MGEVGFPTLRENQTTGADRPDGRTCNAAQPTPRRTHRPVVLVIGPPSDQVGGMATVMRDMAGLDLDGDFQLVVLPTTHSTDARESRPARLARHVRHILALRRTLARRRVAIVHIHTCSGFSLYRSAVDMIVAQSLGCRVILHIHGAGFDQFFDSAGRLQRRLIAWCLRHADRVVALSRRWRDELQRIAPRGRIVVIENGVDIPHEWPREPHNGAVRFLLLARMDEWKGVDDLLDAGAILHAASVRFELVLAGPPGTAGDASILERKIRDRDLESTVRYVGSVQGEEKSRLLAWADVYVQPSHQEGLPIAMLEALAHGLPVVATTVGGMPDVLTDSGAGDLVAPHRPAQLAEALRALAADGIRRTRMSRAARQLAGARFSLDRFRDDILRLYDGLLDEAPDRQVLEGLSGMDKHAIRGSSLHAPAPSA